MSTETPEAPQTRDWFVARLKPGGLDRAIANLERQGYPAFMPQRRTTRRRGGRHIQTTEPVFPGYLFVRIDPAERRWQPVNSTYGVSSLVSLGGAAPSPVPEALMAEFLSRTDAEGMFAPDAVFEEGEKVRVVDGPFAQFVGEVLSIPEEGRIHALFQIMGRPVRADISVGDVERY